MLTQRLGSDTQKDPGFLDALIEKVLANPGCCDEVWLATDYGFPTLETHRKSAQLLKNAAKKLRGAGLRVSLQLSNSIGHGQYMAARDCSGLVYDGSPVEHMVGHDGTVAGYCFCWNGSHFREYTLAELREYVRLIQPYRIWVDDDIRPTNHAPVSYGCFCNHCIRRFNERYGSDFTRETLVHEISFGDLKWRERHIEFLRDTLGEFTREMGNVIHQECPTCGMGLQYAAYGNYTGYGHHYILDAMYESTGIPPATRPGGGSYSDHNLTGFIDKAEFLDAANRKLPDYVTDRRPEIESLPDIVFGKSIGGTCFETSYYLASGNNAMSYAILMNDYEPMDWHGEMLAAFAAHRPYWEKLAAGADNTSQAGLTFAMPKEGWRVPTDRLFGYIPEDHSGAQQLRYLALSIAMKENPLPGEVRLLTAANANAMTDAELTQLLASPVITDADTVQVLNNRGFALPVNVEPIDVARLFERFTDHPVNGNAAGRRWCGEFIRSGGYALVPTDPAQMEWLSEYIKILPADGPDELRIPMKNCGIDRYTSTGQCASAVITTPMGGKWAVFAFDFWHRTVSTEKRNQYVETAAYISGKRQPAELITPIQALLQSRIDRAGRLTQVSVTNVTVADSGPLTLRITAPAGTTVTLMGQYQPELPLTLVPTDIPDESLVTVPNLRPWAVTTLFFA